MRVLPLLIVAVIILFFSGLIVPERSKRLQGWIDQRLQVGEEKGRRKAGWAGNWTAKSLQAGQTINAAVVRAGRRLRDWLPF
jgi:hypothetical protein